MLLYKLSPYVDYCYSVRIEVRNLNISSLHIPKCNPNCKQSPCHVDCKLIQSGCNFRDSADGDNDLHPILALSEKDKVFPRKDFVLLKLISGGEHVINATVFPWKDGTEILVNL